MKKKINMKWNELRWIKMKLSWMVKIDHYSTVTQGIIQSWSHKFPKNKTKRIHPIPTVSNLIYFHRANFSPDLDSPIHPASPLDEKNCFGVGTEEPIRTSKIQRKIRKKRGIFVTLIPALPFQRTRREKGCEPPTSDKWKYYVSLCV